MDSDNLAQKEIYRFLQDLEFLQCLANPLYLECNKYLFHQLDLSNNGYFKEKSFINYLSYLQYFKRPEYIKYITSLIILDLLQFDFVRNQLENPEFINFLRHEIYADWERHNISN